jgi:hypothetical protein
MKSITQRNLKRSFLAGGKTNKSKTNKSKGKTRSKSVKSKRSKIIRGGGKCCNYNAECKNNACNFWGKSVLCLGKKGTCVG